MVRILGVGGFYRLRAWTNHHLHSSVHTAEAFIRNGSVNEGVASRNPHVVGLEIPNNELNRRNIRDRALACFMRHIIENLKIMSRFSSLSLLHFMEIGTAKKCISESYDYMENLTTLRCGGAVGGLGAFLFCLTASLVGVTAFITKVGQVEFVKYNAFYEYGWMNTILILGFANQIAGMIDKDRLVQESLFNALLRNIQNPLTKHQANSAIKDYFLGSILFEEGFGIFRVFLLIISLDFDTWTKVLLISGPNLYPLDRPDDALLEPGRPDDNQP